MASLSTPLWEDCYWRLPLLECRGKTHTHQLYTTPRQLAAYLWPNVKTCLCKNPWVFSFCRQQNKKQNKKDISWETQILTVLKLILLECSPQETAWFPAVEEEGEKSLSATNRKHQTLLEAHPFVPTCTDLQSGLRWDSLKAPKTLQQWAIACSASTALD